MKNYYIAYKYKGNKELDIEPYESWVIASCVNSMNKKVLEKIFDDFASMIEDYTNQDRNSVKSEDIIITFIKELEG